MVKKVLYVMMCAVFLASCPPVTSSNIGGGQAMPKEGGDYAYSNYVLINNRALLRDLQITDIKSRMVNGMMEVQVQVLNKSSRNFSFDYSFSWFDKDGFQVFGVDGHWNPIQVTGNEVKSLIGVAPKVEAQQFKVKIRKSRR